ncbi:hypothetical protein EJ02DRAFT_207346 [Clathrospora elynae]|uniref:Uncharacterized protein n=1 Tax=Clathrospora elynae TaxID=706981 RepID=A0A6A5SP39_9PLEO|nr:hypothetical protein EJ02DRAFT_207346 [Clathrospora elynae]
MHNYFPGTPRPEPGLAAHSPLPRMTREKSSRSSYPNDSHRYDPHANTRTSMPHHFHKKRSILSGLVNVGILLIVVEGAPWPIRNGVEIKGPRVEGRRLDAAVGCG